MRAFPGTARRSRVGAMAAALVAVLAGCTSGSAADPSGSAAAHLPASSSSTARTTSSPPTSTTTRGTTPRLNDVLALGDSLTAGYHPGVGDDKTGGYVGRVVDAWRRARPDAELTNLACSGETTASMQAGGICRYPQGSQLAAARAALERRTTGLVLVSIGANDLLACARGSVDTACALGATGRVETALTSILGQLRSAAPGARIVVLNYYDPLVASWRDGAEGRQQARLSLAAMGALNTAIATAARSAGARVADVAGAFSSTDTSGTPTPVNLDRVCAWTWMCLLRDIHPNRSGYGIISGRVISVM